MVIAFLILGSLLLSASSVHVPPIYPADASSTIYDGEMFDFIVAGSGAAGCPVAYRLAEKGARVALLEAGGNPDIRSRVPMLSQSVLASNLDWRYNTLPNGKSCLASQGQQCRFSRGKLLGGSTSINYMMYVRGNRQDYDDWNITDWEWKSLEKYFLKFEDLVDLEKLPTSSRPYHNTNGPMEIEFFDDPQNAWHERILEGYQQLNFPYNYDVNAESQIGVCKIRGYVNDGERESTARGYLTRAILWKNLKVIKNARVTKVILDNTKNVAVGVNAILKGNRQVTLYANKEVILSTGAVGTPQILLLSGIGPENHLREMGIEVRANLPVGEGLKDHVLPMVVLKIDRGFGINFPNLIPFVDDGVFLSQWLLTQSGPMASDGLTDATAFLNSKFYDLESSKLKNYTNTAFDLPDLQYIHAYIDRDIVPTVEEIFSKSTGLNDATVEQLKLINVNYAFMVLSPVLLTPKSVGWIRLNSTDPFTEPSIFPNYLGEQDDVDILVKSIRIIQDLLETKPFKDNNASLVRLSFPDCDVIEYDSDEYWSCYVRQMTSSVFHGMCTAQLGRVVDKYLRVIGIEGLRVADGSVMPSLPRGNTAAACIAIGEKCADMIIQKHGLNGTPDTILNFGS